VAEILESSDFDGDPTRSMAFLAAQREGLVPTVEPAAAPRDRTTEAPASGETRQLNVEVEGMWCPSCAWLVESVLDRTPGVRRSQVAFVTDLLQVTYDPAVIGPDDIGEKVASLGYEVRRPQGGGAQGDRGPLLRFGLAAFLTANVMTLSYALYAHRMSAVPEAVAGWLPFVLAGLAAPVVFGAGAPVLRRAWYAARQRALTMDSLIALGAVSAFIYSTVTALRGLEDVYFDGACAVVTFWLLGRLLEQAAFRRASQAGEAVRKLLPRKARLLDGGNPHWVSAADLAIGDHIRVAPGERIPVDGRVLYGAGQVSTAVVDGEPYPRQVRVDDPVPGGGTVGDTALDLVVTSSADDSILARIAEHVALATGRRGPGEEIADAIARLFVPLVVVLAVATGAGWIAAGAQIAVAFERALTVLVVSCPCALGVAAPLARVIAAGALARRGIIARGDGALDRIATAQLVAFDKTGTLTHGAPTLDGILTSGAAREKALAMLAALEARSGHAVARAVRQEALQGSSIQIDDLQGVAGQGVHGWYQSYPAAAGRPGWVQGVVDAEPPAEIQRWLQSRQEEGQTTVLVGWERDAWAALSFGDTLRAGVPRVISRLERQGLETAVLSGDAPTATAKMAQLAGIQRSHGDCLPDDKAWWLRQHRRSSGHTAVFVGDGINDAPAMATAVGVAVSSGTDFARESADILLLGPDLGAIPTLVARARNMRRIIHQNLAWAALYNLVALPAAIFGLLSPVLAAFMMVLSGVLVTLNALRLRGREPAATAPSDQPAARPA